MWRLPVLAIVACFTVGGASIGFYTCTVGTTSAAACPETNVVVMAPDPPSDALLLCGLALCLVAIGRAARPGSGRTKRK